MHVLVLHAVHQEVLLAELDALVPRTWDVLTVMGAWFGHLPSSLQ